MMIFGPVANAAHGGHSDPAFDLLVGFAVLALTWFGYLKRKGSPKKVNIWIALGISAICAVFILSGIATLLN